MPEVYKTAVVYVQFRGSQVVLLQTRFYFGKLMATQPALKIKYIKCIHINEYKQLQWINPKFCHERWCRPIGSY